MSEFYPNESTFISTIPSCDECDYNQQYNEITGRSFEPECQSICEVVPGLACGLATLAVHSLAREDSEYDSYITKIKKLEDKDA